jgi:hypothetical protein
MSVPTSSIFLQYHEMFTNFGVLALLCALLRYCDAQMRHLAVYMMLVLGGNATPSKEDVTKALSTVGIEADEARLDHLLSELEGKVCY